jgi:hypothetical protein
MNTPQSEIQPENTKTKHSGLKKLGMIMVIAIIGLYVVTVISTYSFEQTVKNNIITANKDLTRLNVTLDSVTVDVYSGTTDIFRFKVFNPPGYLSPYAISVGEAVMSSGISTRPNIEHLIFDNVTLKDVIINYDLDSKNNVNLYKLIDNLTQSLAPHANFSPLSIFENNTPAKTKLKTPNDNKLIYTGIEFYLEKLTIKKPTINIYSNGILAKSIDMQDIVINFHNIRQPMNYGYAALASSLQIIDEIDKTIRK